jgi:hypothetical protein
VTWADQAEVEEVLEQSEPPGQGKLGLEGASLNIPKEMEAWTTVVKKKKPPAVA